VYEDFYDEFISLVEGVVKPNSDGLTLTTERLLKAFQNPEGLPSRHPYPLSLMELIMSSFKLGSHLPEIFDGRFASSSSQRPTPLIHHLIQSAQIRQNREAYEGFVVHPETKDIMDVDSFCANVVQAMGKEAGISLILMFENTA